MEFCLFHVPPLQIDDELPSVAVASQFDSAQRSMNSTPPEAGRNCWIGAACFVMNFTVLRHRRVSILTNSPDAAPIGGFSLDPPMTIRQMKSDFSPVQETSRA
jgi:hypothetical protein